MHRIFVPPGALQGQALAVTDRRAVHHLVNVLRVAVGEQIECCDGTGQVYQGVVTQRSREGVTVVVKECYAEARPAVRLTLAAALIKPERFEWMIQKVTELGVEAIVPVVTARTTIRDVGGGSTPRLRRWRRIAEEASAQCGRASAPSLEAPQPFPDALAALGKRPGLLATLALPGGTLEAAAPALARAGEGVLLIGPEGDFTLEEAQQAQQRGVVMVRLGQRTLRAETAAIAAVAILQHRLGVL